MKKIPKITMYSFTCPACKHTLTVTRPFEMHYCSFCGFYLKDHDEMVGEVLDPLKMTIAVSEID